MTLMRRKWLEGSVLMSDMKIRNEAHIHLNSPTAAV